MIDWFWPSGSSVTMNVERFERETTSVCTFRLPWRVGFAFGIFAASSLTSSGLGFSITLAAVGSRNSIFATSNDSLFAWLSLAILPGRRRNPFLFDGSVLR